ncbi:hypothetical protein YH64_005135 [Achromobacter sp. LC458]|uniref:GreAB-C-like domain-containing protein n=2 Tax=Achromobacter piechaudii TaxID=72556 RepID=A0ABN7EV50_9BURK|nr:MULTISPECIES: hypothetical protein [Achromobacter]EFF78396.1 hypothetical protein HMPREF0004_0246 [Achromobacter piechaudii ATCC 43553]TRM54096.1 hypothetical protein YH64_005135 [Achromobacter sp. LC458]GLK94777.1 hypothetical protein GCM10008164_25150 [Achromobacter xylosoxidans]CAB3671533.1 hypothetical protein LMG1873_01143 [Achromobacter piechaudii]
MTDQDAYLKAAYAIALANGYSPLIRDELLSNPEILRQDDIETDAVITLGAGNLSFRRSQLFPAIAGAYAGVSSAAIATVSGDVWLATFVPEAKPPNVALMHEGRQLLVAHFALLAPGAEARLQAFQLFADEHQLAGDVVERWRTLLSERMPTDHEIIGLRSDLRNTPFGAVNAVRESLESGNLSLETLVPRSEAYYRQLVGGGGTINTLEAYVGEVAVPFLGDLLADGRQESLVLAWPLCSHQSISHVIERECRFSDDVLADSFARLAYDGDPISRTGAIEVGLSRVHENSALKQPLAELINAFLDGVPDEKADEYELLSALFSCIYGQMARCRILPMWPPFARRLAALTHASLVAHNCLSDFADGTAFVQWLRGANQAHFVMQTIVDLRVEPRWFPELNSAEHWKNELLGRVWVAANAAPEAVEALGLAERLIGETPQAIIRQIDRSAAFFPGPLEGGVQPQIEPPREIAAQIEERLKGAVDTSAFTALINASLLCRVPEQQANQAAEALERCHFNIPVNEQIAVSHCLLGLARIAGINRNSKLCEAVHKALRVSLRVCPGQITAEESFRIGMFACAAHVELGDWAAYVGQFMTELSMQTWGMEETAILRSHLATMAHLVPELWGTCGQADAAFGLALGK